MGALSFFSDFRKYIGTVIVPVLKKSVNLS